MDFFGVYHSNYSRSCGGICDAPCITKGRMMLCADDIASAGQQIAMLEGRLRNRVALAEALDCAKDEKPAMLALRAYLKWGEAYPSHIEGPAATCVMDAGEDVMVLSRDRMGEIPLFYALREDSAAFAGHPDFLLKSDSAEPVADADGLREIFGLGPARTPGRTGFRDVQSVEPGCALVIRQGKRRIDRYFSISPAEHEEDAAATVEHTRGLLEQAVSEVSALRPLVMLSGGLDSTALTALLARVNGSVLSFSVDYQDNNRDFRANAFRPEMDAPYVEMAVRALGTQHRTVTIDQASLARGLGRAVSLRGFPGMADIDSSLMLFAEQLVRYGRDAVSGECGDEVFAGYPWFAGDAAPTGFPWSGSLALRESLLLPEIRGKLKLEQYVRDVFETRRAAADPGAGFSPAERRLMILQKLCFEFFMSNLQERAVRMCQGAGLRVLTPLCDDRLVQYVYNVPAGMKFMGGQEKGLFRAAVRDLLPEKLLKRKKSPYPKTCSPQYAQIVRRMALALVSDKDAPLFQLVDRERVRQIAESDLNPVDTPWFGQLMAGPQLLGYLWQVNRWLAERRVTVRL